MQHAGSETEQHPDSSAETGPTTILTELLSAPSGIAFIYQLLERLRQKWGISDAILVVADPEGGKQVFRLGRRPITTGWEAALVLHAPPGLYVGPDDAVLDQQRDLVVGLASIALRMDVLRRSSLTDAMTGLYNRRSFEDQLARAAERAPLRPSATG